MTRIGVFIGILLVGGLIGVASGQFNRSMMLAPLPTVQTSSSGVPVPAALAGFTNQVVKADFTVAGNFWSNTANYVTQCGAAASTSGQPSTWTFRFKWWNDQSDLPCARIAIITDPDLGGQVLDVKNTVADVAGNDSGAGSYVSFPASTSQNGTWLPIEFYSKAVLRITSSGFNQGPDPNAHLGNYDWWSNSVSFAPGYNDIDWSEISFPSPTEHFYGKFGNFAGGEITSPELDVTQYHTIEGLTTSDGSTVLELCLWFDGTFRNCIAGNIGDYTIHDYRQMLSVTISNEPPAINDIDVYVKSIELWSCPNYLTQSCAGTVVTGP